MTAIVPLLLYFIFVFLLFLAFLPDKQPCQGQQTQQYGGGGGGSAAGQTGIGIKGSFLKGLCFWASFLLPYLYLKRTQRAAGFSHIWKPSVLQKR